MRTEERMFKLLTTQRRGIFATGFKDILVPLKNRIVDHPLFSRTADGLLSKKSIGKVLLDFYPLVEAFPLYMALNLAKTSQHVGPAMRLARRWLTDNIKIEADHADWWMEWGAAFGCSPRAFERSKPVPAVEALTHYLWSTNSRGSLAEGMSATNLAIEWPTGEWAASIRRAMRQYGLDRNSRATRWLELHAKYDEDHPYQATALIAMCIETKWDQQIAFEAAQKSMEYFIMALDASFNCHHLRYAEV